MKVFANLEELLKRLYFERRLLHALFQSRQKYDFRYDDALEIVDDEKNLRLLIDYGILRQEGEMLELEETYQSFFEEILKLNENITSYSVEENLNQLRNYIDYYLKERNNPDAQRKYVKKIMRTLRNIETQSASKTVELKRVINDTYRHERNYGVKRQKLVDYQSTLESIATLIRQTERELDERKDILDVMTSDDRITRLTLEVRLRFKDVFHSLIELQHTIRDYLHQIDAHNKLVKRIRKLKYLKDQLTWERTTDVRSIIRKNSHLIYETATYYSTKVSLSYLRNTDAGLETIAQIRKSLTQRNELRKVNHPPLSDSEMSIGYVVEDFIDTDVIAKAFFASSQDLYTFVKNYRYSQSKDMNQKMEYYTEIILNHHDQLQITNEWGKDGDIYYPLIYNLP